MSQVGSFQLGGAVVSGKSTAQASRTTTTASPTTPEVVNLTTGIGRKTFLDISGVDRRLGEFQLGEKTLSFLRQNNTLGGFSFGDRRLSSLGSGPLTASSETTTTSPASTTSTGSTPRSVDPFTESIDGQTTLASASAGLSTPTTETTSGLIQTALTSTLAAISDSKSVGGSKTSVETFVTTVDAEATSTGGEVTSAVGTPILSTVTTTTTADGIVETLASASILAASADTAAGGGETVVVSTSTDTGTATTSVDGVALLQTPDATPKTVDPPTETTGLGLKTLVELIRNNELGAFSMGDRPLSSLEGGPLTGEAIPSKLASVTPQSISATPKDSPVFSESTDGNITPTTASAFLADSLSETTTISEVQTVLSTVLDVEGLSEVFVSVQTEDVNATQITSVGSTSSTDGDTTNVVGSSLTPTPNTDATADGIAETLASGVILAASGDTAASGGETVRMLGDGGVGVASTSVSAPAQRQTAAFTAATVDPTTETTAESLKAALDTTAILAASESLSTSDSDITGTDGTPLSGSGFSEGIAGQTTRASASTTSASPTTKTTAGLIQTALASTIAVTPDTQTTGVGETTTTDTFVTSVDPDTALTGGAEVTSVVGSPVISTVTTKATADGIVETLASATVLGASADTAAAGAETILVSTSTDTGTGSTNVEGVALLQDATTTAARGDVSNETTASSRKTLLNLNRNTTLGTFSVGSGEFGSQESGPLRASPETSTVDPASIQPSGISPLTSPSFSGATDGSISVIGASALVADSLSESTSISEVQEVLSTALEVDGFSKGFGNVQVTTSDTTTFLSEPFTSSIGGEVTTLNGLPLTPTANTKTTADGIVETLASASILGASADTFAVGGETVVLSASGRGGKATTSVESPALLQSILGEGSVGTPSTETSAVGKKTFIDLSKQQLRLGGFRLGDEKIFDNIEQYNQVGEYSLGDTKFEPEDIGPITADSLTSSTSESDIQSSLTFPLTSPVFSESTDGSITPLSALTLLSDSTTATTAGQVQTALGAVLGASPTTQTDTDAVVATLASGTVLASSAFTAASGAETLKVNLDPQTGLVNTSVLAPALFTTISGTPQVVDPPTTTTSDGETIDTTATPLTSPVKSTSTSGLLQSMLASGFDVDPFTETTAGTRPTLSTLDERELGTFKLGEPGGADTTLSGRPRLPDSIAENFAEGRLAEAQTNAILADSLSEGISGNITPSTASGLLADVFSEGIAPGDVGTLVTATFKAGSAFTEVTGGETLTLTLSPNTSSIFTSVTGDSVIQETTLQSTDLDSFTNAVSELDIRTPIETQLKEAGAITETLAISAKTSPSFSPILSDAIGAITGVVPNPTLVSAVSTDTDSIGAITGVVLTPTGLSVIPIEGIRYLDDWAIAPGPTEIGTIQVETRTFSQMVLEFSMRKELLINNFRPQIQNSGKLEVVPDTEGGYQTIDMASGTNRIEIFPPTDHSKVRSVEKWLIESFEETPLGTAADYYDVEITLVPDKEKAHDNEYGTLISPPDKTRDDDEWLFEFFYGDVSTRRVTSDLDKTREGALDTAELTLILTGEEVRVIEESVSKLNAVKEIEVPDGGGDIRDTNAEDRNTVQVTVPDIASDTLESGEYIVTAWETEWRRGRSHEVTITLKK